MRIPRQNMGSDSRETCENERFVQEDVKMHDDPPYTTGDAQVVMTNDGSRDCPALLLTSEMVAKISQVATRARRLEFINRRLKEVKRDLTSSQNMVEYKQDALQDTNDQAEIARIHEDIDSNQQLVAKARKSMDDLEEEIVTLTANLGYSRDQSQEMLEGPLESAGLLDIPDPETGGEKVPSFESGYSDEPDVNQPVADMFELYGGHEDFTEADSDETGRKAARNDLEAKREALMLVDEAFEHRQEHLAEDKAEYRRRVKEGTCSLTETEFDLLGLEDFRNMTADLRNAQEAFEESFKHAKQLGALEEGDAHYQESVFSDYNGGYPLSMEDAMMGSAPSAHIFAWQDSMEQRQDGCWSGGTELEPWADPDLDPEPLEMEDCDVKSAAISDSWSCVDHSRNRRRIDRWREIAGRESSISVRHFMSRRAPNPAAERAAQNQQTIKTLLKLEGNKSCADCKRNKHPRWASWNLGIFVCIRYEISPRRVGYGETELIIQAAPEFIVAWEHTSVESNRLILMPGRTNSYRVYCGGGMAERTNTGNRSWHLVIKIENFIRTKYESKRWVMDGPMPDPTTLDAEGDDDVPLNVVQEKAKMERSASQRMSSTSSQPAPPVTKPAANIDLFGDVPAPPARPSTTDIPNARPPPPKATVAAPKPQKQGDSLLGLDFFGGSAAASTTRPTSASSGGRASSTRPDLKQSILSLYSSAPRTPSQPQPQSESQDIFGGMQSAGPQQASASGGLNDAFSGLSFGSATSPPPPQAPPNSSGDPFATLSKPSVPRSSFTSPPIKSPAPLSGGGFFDTGTKLAAKPQASSKPPPPIAQPLRAPSASNGLSDFSFASTNTAPSAQPPTSNISNDLFDFSDPLPSQNAAKPKPPPPSDFSSAFNLSAPAPHSQPAAKSTPVAAATSDTFSGFSNDDPWGSSNAWAVPEPSMVSKPKAESKSPAITMSNDFSSWGNSMATSSAGGGTNSKDPPKIAADEDFGGWNSAAPETPAAVKPPPTTSKPSGGGFGNNDDLFSNVWQ
ncbi:MAG: hypothetical protein Q9222_002496 [Ikaeria aurantiellina]